MIDLLPIFYALINRWIGHGAYQGKNIGRALFALPVAYLVYATQSANSIVYGMLSFIVCYLARNLPHGKHYTIGKGSVNSGFLADFFYMMGKGACIFAPLIYVDFSAFLVGALSWPVSYVLGWIFAKGDTATMHAEIFSGVFSGIAVLIAIQNQVIF